MTPRLSQVGRALAELDIDSILAGSPQAKGRVERLWGTFQDRLVVELRLAGVVDRDGANAFLVGFLPRYNARFTVPALDPVSAWRALPDGLDLDRILAFKYRRKVAKDHTVTLDGRTLQLPAGRPVERTTPASWSRSTSRSTARSWPMTACAVWRRHPHPPTRSSFARQTRSAPPQASSRQPLRSPGRRRGITHGNGSHPGASSRND